VNFCSLFAICDLSQHGGVWDVVGSVLSPDRAHEMKVALNKVWLSGRDL